MIYIYFNSFERSSVSSVIVSALLTLSAIGLWYGVFGEKTFKLIDQTVLHLINIMLGLIYVMRFNSSIINELNSSLDQ